METVFKSEQVYILSDRLGITQKDVKKVIDSYVDRLLYKVSNGETVKFLNICYLVPEGRSSKRVKDGYNSYAGYLETLSYISNDIGVETRVGKETAYRILSELGNFIADDLKKFYSYTIRGIINVSLEEYGKGVFKVRVRKSKTLKDMGVKIVTLNSFKRKVES